MPHLGRCASPRNQSPKPMEISSYHPALDQRLQNQQNQQCQQQQQQQSVSTRSRSQSPTPTQPQKSPQKSPVSGTNTSTTATKSIVIKPALRKRTHRFNLPTGGSGIHNSLSPSTSSSSFTPSTNSNGSNSSNSNTSSNLTSSSSSRASSSSPSPSSLNLNSHGQPFIPSWRKDGLKRRQRILQEDEENGGIEFHIDRNSNLKNYYAIADRVLDQFQQTCESSNKLEETYVMGNRLLKFLSDVLSTHKHYYSKDKILTQLRIKSQNDLAQTRNQMDDIALMIDKQIYQAIMEREGLEGDLSELEAVEDASSRSRRQRKRVTFNLSSQQIHTMPSPSLSLSSAAAASLEPSGGEGGSKSPISSLSYSLSSSSTTASMMPQNSPTTSSSSSYSSSSSPPWPQQTLQKEKKKSLSLQNRLLTPSAHSSILQKSKNNSNFTFDNDSPLTLPQQTKKKKKRSITPKHKSREVTDTAQVDRNRSRSRSRSRYNQENDHDDEWDNWQHFGSDTDSEWGSKFSWPDSLDEEIPTTTTTTTLSKMTDVNVTTTTSTTAAANDTVAVNSTKSDYKQTNLKSKKLKSKSKSKPQHSSISDHHITPQQTEEQMHEENLQTIPSTDAVVIQNETDDSSLIHHRHQQLEIHPEIQNRHNTNDDDKREVESHTLTSILEGSEPSSSPRNQMDEKVVVIVEDRDEGEEINNILTSKNTVPEVSIPTTYLDRHINETTDDTHEEFNSSSFLNESDDDDDDHEHEEYTQKIIETEFADDGDIPACDSSGADKTIFTADTDSLTADEDDSENDCESNSQRDVEILRKLDYVESKVKDFQVKQEAGESVNNKTMTTDDMPEHSQSSELTADMKELSLDENVVVIDSCDVSDKSSQMDQTPPTTSIEETSDLNLDPPAKEIKQDVTQTTMRALQYRNSKAAKLKQMRRRMEKNCNESFTDSEGDKSVLEEESSASQPDQVSTKDLTQEVKTVAMASSKSRFSKAVKLKQMRKRMDKNSSDSSFNGSETDLSPAPPPTPSNTPSSISAPPPTPANTPSSASALHQTKETYDSKIDPIPDESNQDENTTTAVSSQSRLSKAAKLKHLRNSSAWKRRFGSTSSLK